MFCQKPHPEPCHSRRLPPATGAAVLLTSLLVAASAHANLLWQWQYHNRDTTACGTLQTVDTPNTAGYYSILSIEGRRVRVRISGLYPAGQAIPGNGMYRIDNLIKEGGDEKVTVHGFAFVLASGAHANPFFLPGKGYIEVYTNSGNFSERPVRFSAWRLNTTNTVRGKRDSCQ